MKARILDILLVAGMLMLAIGIALPLLTMDSSGEAYRYIFAAGAVMVLVSRILLNVYDVDLAKQPLRVRRLRRIEVWSAVFYCAGAFFMFYNPGVLRDSIALVLAGAVIQCYTALMIPRLSNSR